MPVPWRPASWSSWLSKLLIWVLFVVAAVADVPVVPPAVKLLPPPPVCFFCRANSSINSSLWAFSKLILRSISRSLDWKKEVFLVSSKTFRFCFYKFKIFAAGFFHGNKRKLHAIQFIRVFSKYPVLGTLIFFTKFQYSKSLENPWSFWPFLVNRSDW